MSLEAAYQFNVYGASSLWFGFWAATVNGIALSSVLSLASLRLRKSKSGGMFVGSIILLAGVAMSVWLASLCLPSSPVTLAQFQSEPALAAFFKNTIVYFLPLACFFVLMPFYTVSVRELMNQGKLAFEPFDMIQVRPDSLIIICLLAVVYSLLTTFYMLDRLQIGPYHNLFVTLIVLRFIVYFGLGIGSLLWYRKMLGGSNIPPTDSIRMSAAG